MNTPLDEKTTETCEWEDIRATTTGSGSDDILDTADDDDDDDGAEKEEELRRCCDDDRLELLLEQLRSLYLSHNHEEIESEEFDQEEVEMKKGLHEQKLVDNPTSSESSESKQNNDDDRLSCGLECFSDEIMALILSHLDLEDILLQVSFVSRAMYESVRFNNSLWKQLFHHRWNVTVTASTTAAAAVSIPRHQEKATQSKATTASSMMMNLTSHYYTAYQQAHSHPHDLWITHSNCVFPSDGLMTPGQCCIPTTKSPIHNFLKKPNNCKSHQEKEQNPPAFDPDLYCPSCRYALEETAKDTVASSTSKNNEDDDPWIRKRPKSREQAMDRATRILRRKLHRGIHGSIINDSINNNNIEKEHLSSPSCQTTKVQAGQQQQRQNSATTARSAFSCAATFHRTLQTRQYEKAAAAAASASSSCPVSMTNFLTDALFFNLSEFSTTSQGAWEVDQLYKEVAFFQQQEEERGGGQLPTVRGHHHHHHNQSAGTNTDSCLQHETALHSWHVIELRNPSFDRPIIFQFGVQRPECFTVYPSEGYLNPGQCTRVTLGVRPFGSALAYAFEALNFQREGLSMEPWADDVYATQAHLPLCPFLVRYRYAVTAPLVSVPLYSRRNRQGPATTTAQGRGLQQQQRQRQQQNRRRRLRRRSRAAPSAAQETPIYDPLQDDSTIHETQSGNKLFSFSCLKQTLDYHWRQPVPGRFTVQEIKLSAHVHAHYPFWMFWANTCQEPSSCINNNSSLTTNIASSSNGSFFFAPTLETRFPDIYHQLVLRNQSSSNNNNPCHESGGSAVQDFFSRHPCHSCGARWNLDHEQARHAFELFRGYAAYYQRQRRILVQNIAICIQYCSASPQRKRELRDRENSQLVADAINQNGTNHIALIEGEEEYLLRAALLYKMTSIVQALKASPWTNLYEKQVFLQVEAVLDELYRKIPVGGEEWIPWRLEGVYRYAICTDSVFNRDEPLIKKSKDMAANTLSCCVNDKTMCGVQFKANQHCDSTTVDVFSKNIICKEEPDYLDTFRHLAHSPGRFCLGPQEDPNHLAETSTPNMDRRYYRRQVCSNRDFFMDDAVMTWQVGICMLHDPRSLLVHGLYDRIFFPGTIVRRPLESIPPLLGPDSRHRKSRRDHDELSGKSEKVASFQASRSAKQVLLSKLNQDREEKTSLIQSRLHLNLARLQNSLDVSSMAEADAMFSNVQNGDLSEDETKSHLAPARLSSMTNYLENIPPVGVGRFPVSCLVKCPGHTIVAPVALFDGEDDESAIIYENLTSSPQEQGQFERPIPHHALQRNFVGPRVLSLLMSLGAQLGLAVIDNPDSHTVFVDRTILISMQWVCISLMALPLLWTLCARYAQVIPTRPVDYELVDFPFEVGNEMRFLTEGECGVVAFLIVLLWLALGRWAERHTSRDFFRVMLEHVTPPPKRRKGLLKGYSSFRKYIVMWLQRQWDAVCPLFWQRRVFTPHWNRRTRVDIIKHLCFWRARFLPKQRAVSVAEAGRGARYFGDGRDEGLDIGYESKRKNVLVGTVVCLGSFCSSSPHFWLNLLTVFACSISLGMSVSLRSMEKGGIAITSNNEHNRNANTGSILTAFSLVTVVILSTLVGQLVGSSGGTMFLAEFIVTSISLILGGAGTISASAMESWGCFFCLSSMAFWGYLFGRVALMDGIRQKRRSYSTILLSNSVTFLVCFWFFVFLVTKWDVPADLVIDRSFQDQQQQNMKSWCRWPWSWFWLGQQDSHGALKGSNRHEVAALRLQ